MANPKWFNADKYLENKLAQLQATDPEGNWTVYSMAQAFANEGYEGEEGAYQHFLDYGMAEEVSPNALFDAETYYANKLASLQSNAETAEEWADKTVDDVKAAFDEAGLSAWEHYQQYGTAEGINPSAEFDTAKYLQAKADALNAAGGDKVWTAEDVAEAFADAGLNALEHYELYGKSGAEGEVAEGYNPAPIVTLTFADALAAETLPDEYFLADGAASLEGVAVADLEAAQAEAQSIFDGALNKADLEYSVDYTLTDTLANLMAADAAVVEGAAGYELTDGSIDLGDGSVEDITAAIADAQAVIDGATNADGFTLDATYTLEDSLQNLMAADAALLEGHTYTLMDGAADLGVDLTIEAVTAAQAAAQAVIDGSANETKPELVATYTLNDSLANIMNPDNAALVEGHAYSLLDGAADFGTDQTIEAVTAAQAAAQAVIDGSANETKPELAATYTLNDTLANIMAADAALVEGHTYTLTDDATVDFGTDLTIEAVTAAQAAAQAVIDGSANETKPELAATYTLNDTLANIMAADAALVEGHTYTLTDDATVDFGTDLTIEAVTAAQAAAQAVIDGSANETKPELVATYTLNDSLANIMNPDNAALVEGHAYSLTDTVFDLGNNVTVAGVDAAKTAVADAAQAVIDAAANASGLDALTYTFVLNDSVANIAGLGALPDGATGYILTDSIAAINGASASLILGAEYYVLDDTLQNIMNADNAVLLQDAESYTLSAAEMTISGTVTVAAAKATLAEAQDVIDGAGNAAELTLDATFSLTDSVANLQSDSALLSQAQAYNIMDTASHIAEASAAFVGAAGNVTVADTLTAIDAASGVFAAGIDTVVAHVDTDTMISLATLHALDALDAEATLNVAAGDTVAVSVNAADEAGPVTIDLSALHVTVGEGASITFNAIGSVGNDTITAHANGGIINGGLGDDTLNAGAGVDILTGAAGADTFVFATAATSTTTATDHITDFVGGTDKIAFQNAATFEIVTVDGATGLADAVAKAFTAAAGANDSGIEALQFAYDGKTYFAIEADASSNEAGALVVDVTGVSGSVTEADFIAVS